MGPGRRTYVDPSGPVTDLRRYDRVHDRVRLHRQVASGPILLVEGVSDQRFCRRVFASEDIEIFIVGTRSGVVEVADQLARAHVHCVVGLVDRDFDDVVDRAIANGVPLIPYDGADLEGMLLDTEAFSQLLQEFGSAEKVASYGGVEAVRQTVMSLVEPLARLRAANAQKNWGLVFDAVDLAAKLKVSDPKFQEMAFCDALLSSSPKSVCGRQDLLSVWREKHRATAGNGVVLIRGRDALAVLGVLLRRKIGSLTRDQAQADHLAGSLRLAASSSTVRRTTWHQALTRWLSNCH